MAWETPYYELKGVGGKQVLIDVTSSVQPGLEPSKAIYSFIELLNKKKVETVLDFGAGAFRFTFPLLDSGFQVCGVEYAEQFKRPGCTDALRKAEKHPNFSTLIWPKDFIANRRRFDAALLCYVLQTMPIPSERETVVEEIERKLYTDSYLLYMSRYNQMDGTHSSHRVSDGYYKWPDREHHSFYREFKTEETHKTMKDFGFRHVRSLSERGTDQIFVYATGKATWI